MSSPFLALVKAQQPVVTFLYVSIENGSNLVSRTEHEPVTTEVSVPVWFK